MVASISRPARSLAERFGSAREMYDVLATFGGTNRNSPRILELAQNLANDKTEMSGPSTVTFDQAVTHKMGESIPTGTLPLTPRRGPTLAEAMAEAPPESRANPFGQTRLASSVPTGAPLTKPSKSSLPLTVVSIVVPLLIIGLAVFFLRRIR